MLPNPNILRFTHAPATSPWANPLMGLDNEGPAQPVHIAPNPQRAYYDTDRLKTLAVYAETGNTVEAARTMGIPRQTVADWVNDDGTPQLLDELRSTLRYELGWQLASKVKALLSGIEDDPYDEVVTKHGAIVLKRVPWKDRVIGFSILTDKWALISGALSQSNAIVSRLDQLGHQLRDMGSSLLATSDSPSPSPIPLPQGGPLPHDPLGENLVW